MLTVQDLLKADVFNNSEVLAGQDGLSREIKTITIAEVPDSANWLRGGELVCTTAFFISRTVVHQESWIKNLIHNGASALAIKTSRFLGVVPQSIIDIGNKFDFAILGLPHETTWPAAIESFMDFFVNQRIKVMEKVDTLQSTLINLALEDKSLQEIVDEIARVIENPVILEDTRLNVIAIGSADDYKSPNVEKKLIDHRTSNRFREKLLSSDYYKQVQLGRKKGKLEIELSIEEVNQKCIIVPIYSNKSIYGFISFIDCKEQYNTADLITLESSSKIIAMELVKQFLSERTYQRKTMALIDDLIQGRIYTQMRFEYDYSHFNWSAPMCVVLVELLDYTSESDYFWDNHEQVVMNIIKKRLKKNFSDVLIGSDSNLFTTVVSFSKNNKKLIKEDTMQIGLELEEIFGKKIFHIGAGNIYDSIDQLRKSFKEANTALMISKRFQEKGPVIFFDDIGIHRIFSMIKNPQDIREFCDEFLSDLIENDPNEKTGLLETLHNYLLSDCVVKETAKKMYLHPNTVAYRIRKIREIIKHDLDKMEIKLIYLFALESKKLFVDPSTNC